MISAVWILCGVVLDNHWFILVMTHLVGYNRNLNIKVLFEVLYLLWIFDIYLIFKKTECVTLTTIGFLLQPFL